ncbi:hypothetical protein [Candidatus Nanohalovita haloferacivicina]|uniref:hypothetical protein n=1 Tax=Candidatus Nanohalovita haloferacivicina TaxID=2978046 RepID=UPI00325FD368|nr:hypothetical protein HBNXNv_0980 [Candidatus Nanohalobia archaeon BNXNv]
MGLLDRFTGGSNETENQEEQQEQTLQQEETIEEASPDEKQTQELIEFGPENNHTLPEDKQTDVDETLQKVEDPVEFLSNKDSEGLQTAYDNSFIAEALRTQVTDEKRRTRGAFQTAATTELWAKNPEANELVANVAAEAGMSADDVYDEMADETKEEVITSLVGRELYGPADSFATESESLDTLAEAIEQEIGREIKEEHEDLSYIDTGNLDEEQYNKVVAVMTSLSEEGKSAIDDEHLGLDNFNWGNNLDNESKARLNETIGSSWNDSAKRAVEDRWENEEYSQAALLAETFEVDQVEVDDGRSYSDRTKEINDVAKEAVEKYRRSGDYEQAVELAGEIPGGVQRTELLEDLAVHIDDEEEAFQVATAGYTEDDVMNQALEYVDQQVQEGNTEAYEQLNSATDYDIAEELSAEAQTDIQLAGL